MFFAVSNGENPLSFSCNKQIDFQFEIHSVENKLWTDMEQAVSYRPFDYYTFKIQTTKLNSAIPNTVSSVWCSFMTNNNCWLLIFIFRKPKASLNMNARCSQLTIVSFETIDGIPPEAESLRNAFSYHLNLNQNLSCFFFKKNKEKIFTNNNSCWHYNALHNTAFLYF